MPCLGLCILESGIPQYYFGSLFFFIFVIPKEKTVENLKGSTAIPVLQVCCQVGMLVTEL